MDSKQLRQILKELNVKHDESASRMALQAIAQRHNALQRWEKLHTADRNSQRREKMRRRKAKKQHQSTYSDAMSELFKHDGNKDGKLTRKEFSKFAPDHGEGLDDSFRAMDKDGDDKVSRKEAAAFFDMVNEREDYDGVLDDSSDGDDDDDDDELDDTHDEL